MAPDKSFFQKTNSCCHWQWRLGQAPPHSGNGLGEEAGRGPRVMALVPPLHSPACTTHPTDSSQTDRAGACDHRDCSEALRHPGHSFGEDPREGVQIAP